MLKLPTKTMKTVDFPAFPTSDRFSKISTKKRSVSRPDLLTTSNEY